MPVVNYGTSKRGTLTKEDMRIRNPNTPLTPAQRRKDSMNRRAEEEKESGRIVTPAGGAGLIIGFVPGLGRGAAAVGKGVYKVGEKIYKTFSAAKKANPRAKPNALVKKLQQNEAAAAKMGKPAPKPMSRPEKIARVATGQGTKGRRSGTAIRNKKGQLIGVKNKDARISKGVRDMAGPAARAAGVVAASAAAGSPSQDKPLSDLPTRTIATRNPIPVDDTPRPKREPIAPEVSSGSSSKSSDGETIGEYFSNLKGRKTKVKTPFGTIDVDSSDAAYNMEPEFSGDYKGGRPGMKKNAVRRNAGGTVGRGMGKALRGGGKVMR